MGGGVGRDGRQVVLEPIEPVQVALDVAEPARDGMRVRVGEAGQDRPAAKVDDAGPRSAKREDVAVRAEGDDAIAGDRDGRAPRSAQPSLRPGRIVRIRPPWRIRSGVASRMARMLGRALAAAGTVPP